MVRNMFDTRMKIRPVDFSILARLLEGRNVASNLHRELDVTHQYVNERLAQMEDYGLIDRIGPSETSGLYEITELGRIALEHREDYYDEDVDFDQLLEDELNSA